MHLSELKKAFSFQNRLLRYLSYPLSFLLLGMTIGWLLHPEHPNLFRAGLIGFIIVFCYLIIDVFVLIKAFKRRKKRKDTHSSLL